jgi:hypothetical protein
MAAFPLTYPLIKACQDMSIQPEQLPLCLGMMYT